jgi:hypothetical protein
MLHLFISIIPNFMVSKLDFAIRSFFKLLGIHFVTKESHE